MDLRLLIRVTGNPIADDCVRDAAADFLLPLTACRLVVDGGGESDASPLSNVDAG